VLAPHTLHLNASHTQQLQHTPAFEGVSSAVENRRAGGRLLTLQMH
jgi:hypothetical protein